MNKHKAMISVAALCCYGITTCNNPEKQEIKETVSDTVITKVKTDTVVPMGTAQKMLGAWSAVEGKAGEVTFIINDTTFFYPPHKLNHRYKLDGDSVKIFFNGFADTFGVEFSGNDTLRLTGGEDGPGVYKRVDFNY